MLYININIYKLILPDWRNIFSKLSEKISSRIVAGDHEHLTRSARRHADSHFFAGRPYHLGKVTCGQKQNKRLTLDLTNFFET